MSIRCVVGSTHTLELQGLINEETSAYINDASSVQVTALTDADGATVGGLTLPLTLNYVASSNGVYRAQLPLSVGFKLGWIYDLTIVATLAGGEKRTFTERFVATSS